VGCGAASGGGPSGTPTHAPTATPTPDISVVADGYLAAYNTMITADNLLVTKQNAENIGDPALATTIHARSALRSTFDTTVAALDASQFPKASADITAVLNADAAVEDAFGTLAVNTDNVSNFNSIFSTYTSAQATFVAADSAVARDLGQTRG
jgi:predicted transcriptional regulator